MKKCQYVKRRFLLFAICSLLCGVATAQVSFGHAEKMNEGWRFLRMDSASAISEQPGMKAKDFDDSRWRSVDLPHDWGVELPMSPDKGSCQGYLPGGVAWYRKKFEVGCGQRHYIYFEGVYSHSEVWLNGHLLGKRPSGFASFLYDMTPYLEKGENVLAVRVDHSEEADARWYTGSGIYRNVWLVSAPQVHLAQWGTAYRLKSIHKKKAELEVDVETTDDSPDDRATNTPDGHPQWFSATVLLYDKEGREVATAQTPIGCGEKKTVRLTVENPQRWTLDSPYLYTLKTILNAPALGGSPAVAGSDTSVVRVGLRTLEFSPDKGFALNGEWMKVKGVCVHDDAGVLGTAVPKEVWRRRLLELKAIGANALRMSHNPHAPEVYDLCDELGLLVMDEASDEWEYPKRKWMKGWNVGVPAYQGTYAYFQEWIDRDVADLVRRDRCHPSIFLWSIGNEVDYPNDPYSHPVLDGDGSFTQPMYGGYKPGQPDARRIGDIAQRLAKIVKDIDPSRPTTGALAGVVMSNETAYPSAVDVVGYNYTESRYGEDHRNYPQRVIYGSENRHDLPAWKSVTDNDHIFGQFLWTGIDYLGESGPYPARGSSAGLLDLAGQRKPLGWYRAALWSTKPVCYIGSYRLSGRMGRNGSRRPDQRPHPYADDRWDWEKGDQVRVVCYTNAKTARLLLNGREVGGAPQYDAGTGILYWDLDYEPGTLRCEADNGAAYEVASTGRPFALRLATDSVAHVFVEVVDEQGRRVHTADNEVTLMVRGARLLGMEHGNTADATINGRQQRNRLRTYGGRLVAYILPDDGQKQFTVSASSPFLQGQHLTVDMK